MAVPDSVLKDIAQQISAEDRECIVHRSASSIRRSHIEVVPDEETAATTNEKGSAVAVSSGTNTANPKKRRAVAREWPDVATTVIAHNPWTKEKTEVEVVAAPHRKAGREFLYNGTRYHSPSPMCRDIFGKRVSNGWKCISW